MVRPIASLKQAIAPTTSSPMRSRSETEFYRASDGSHYREAFHVGDSRKRSFIAPAMGRIIASQSLKGDRPLNSTIRNAIIEALNIRSSRMDIKELFLKEVENIPEPMLEEVWDFLLFLKQKRDGNTLETSLLSQSSLEKDWLCPEEDEAWKNL